ncbi:MAG: hypothetical protein BWY88_00783 [Synergistetes bacterium ADurb.Bin520]|nr:MAG: hypothetical protein BWY88_00783 [Synergistetes bacterium ADurb.Bin520]
MGLFDEASGHGHGIAAETQAVGAHVGDEPHRSSTGKLHPLVELLGHRHGFPGGKAQAPGGLLLKGAGFKGRKGGAAALFFPEGRHRQRLSAQDGLRAPGLFFALRGPPFAGALLQPQREGARPIALGLHVHQPVLPGDEAFDLSLPLRQKAKGHGLHPASGKAGLDFFPQQGGEGVPHDAIQHPAGLLGLHPTGINGFRSGHGLLDALGGNLVHANATGGSAVHPQGLGQVPGYGLPFPIGVRGQKDSITFGGLGLELF